MFRLLIIFLFLLSITFVNSVTANLIPSTKPIKRQVSITFDDLPQQGQQEAIKPLKEMTSKLINQITKNKIPAIGFVNESKLYQNDELKERTAILQLWLDAGLELGNHTYSHPYFYRTSLTDFQENVLQGEKITNTLVKNRKVKYFRHPFLNTGPDLETKTAFEKFLLNQNYVIAPVTIDNSEWLFANVYRKAKEQNDKKTADRVAAEYIPYMEKMFAFYEKLSLDVVGYEVPQILLLHANLLNAEHLDKLIEMLKGRNYQFISLEEALKDKSYNLSDKYTGKVGVSWLHRWAITKGMQMQKEPALPEFMEQFDQPGVSGSGFKSAQKASN